MGLNSTPIHRKVSLIIHAPRSADGVSLQQAFGWNDPDRLVDEFIADMREASYEIAQFEIVERTEVDEFPIKQTVFAMNRINSHRIGAESADSMSPIWWTMPLW